ncbi:hypothetical protein V9T40_002936 [Parthenolecanium corni]|uniref:Uncharacterized protein n=1 Tax=Parthenolecanium corni TaxID=536013 RepID=A0AAN9TLN0_9HEMI
MDITIKYWEFLIGVRCTIESRECEMFPEWISLLELSHGLKFLLALTFNVSVLAIDMKQRLTATEIPLKSYCEIIDDVYSKYSSKIHGTEIENEMSDEQWTNLFKSLEVGSNVSKQSIKIEETLKENGVRHVCVVRLPKPGNRNLFTKKVFIGVKNEDSERMRKILREPKVVRAFSFPGDHFLIIDTYTAVKRENI